MKGMSSVRPARACGGARAWVGGGRGRSASQPYVAARALPRTRQVDELQREDAPGARAPQARPKAATWVARGVAAARATAAARTVTAPRRWHRPTTPACDAQTRRRRACYARMGAQGMCVRVVCGGGDGSGLLALIAGSLHFFNGMWVAGWIASASLKRAVGGSGGAHARSRVGPPACPCARWDGGVCAPPCIIIIISYCCC